MGTEVQLSQLDQVFRTRDGRLDWSNTLDVAFSGGLKDSKLRSLAWKLAAGLLNVCETREEMYKDWVDASRNLRQEYEKLKAEVVVNPHDIVQQQEVVFDPLGGMTSSSEKNPWVEYHQDKELLDEITKDLQRLFPSGCGEFFMQDAVSDILRSVLFVWCKLHPDTSYRQGMHELAAPILYCMYQEAIPSRKQNVNSEPKDEMLKICLDMAYLEHDLFWLFERVMRDMKPLFIVSKKNMSQREIQRAKQSMLRNAKLGKSNEDAGVKKKEDDAPIIELSNRIQYDVLKNVDGALERHLESLQIEPQLYLLRWLRLLFSREFEIEQTMLLWDSIFADAFQLGPRIKKVQQDQKSEPPLDPKSISDKVKEYASRSSDEGQELVGIPITAIYFAVAMLTYIRSDLLVDDYCIVLQYLMKYPNVDNAHAFVHLAFNLRNSISSTSEKIVVKEAEKVPTKQPSSTLKGAQQQEQEQEQQQQQQQPQHHPPPHHHQHHHHHQQQQPQKAIPPPKPEKVRQQETGRSSSPVSPMENFFKEIGEKIENIFVEGDKEPRTASSSTTSSSSSSSSINSAATLVDDLESQNRNLIKLQKRMGDKLSTIASTLEDLVQQADKEDAILQQIAHIKQVRDILFGRIAESECFKPPSQPTELKPKGLIDPLLSNDNL